mmetsp:Transcript_11858/g.20989  ORF Transcript_11858/g.20989 Transcript_11858/m.20989 type:complete len:398 (+) Transcript_11858:43-1236(+)
MVAMKAALGLLLAPLAASEAASAADVQAQQAKFANDMGNHYKSMYAPGSPALGASPADAASQAKIADEMGKFYRAQYAPAGMPLGSGATSQTDVQAQQAKVAADMGSYYRSQYAPGVEAQMKAQQAAQAQQKPAAEKVKAPEVFLAAELTTAAPAPAMAKDCNTMDELNAWYKARKDNLDKYVPKDYRHFADDALKKEYDANQKRIEAPPAPPTPADSPKPGPVLFASEGQASDPASDPLADFTKRFQHEVGDVDDQAKQTADATADKVDKAADSFKRGFSGALKRISEKSDEADSKVHSRADEIAKQVSEKADEVRRQADGIASKINEQQKADKESPKSSMLIEEEASSHARLHKLLRALTLFGGPALLCGFIAHAVIKRQARQSEEAPADYFMAL